MSKFDGLGIVDLEERGRMKIIEQKFEIELLDHKNIARINLRNFLVSLLRNRQIVAKNGLIAYNGISETRRRNQ